MLLALLSGCSVDSVGSAFGGFGWPEHGISLQAHRMYDLWIASTIAALVVGFFVWGLIFWCIIRYRKRGDNLPVQTRFNMPLEILYTVTPVLIVAVLFYYTAIVQTDVDKLSKNPDQVVEVVAFKWQWQFNYRDGIGEKAQTVASTTGSADVIPLLVLPVGEKIRFEETSKDVIHSFWVPELLFKRDVFPGSVRNVFEVTDRTWRGIGMIPASGWRLSDAYREFDAEARFDVASIRTAESAVCRSGEVLQGLIKPNECAAFGRECTPRNPLGATMVSSEGACAAYYLYRRLDLVAAPRG